MITFYTLFCYTFDLQEQVGDHAWLDLELRQDQYRESPVRYMPLEWDWEDRHYQSAGPPSQAQREYIAMYAAKWGSRPPLPYPRTAQEAADIDAYIIRWGVDPRLLLSKGQPVWSIWFHVTDPTWMMAAHAGIVLCSFLFMIGLGTRITAALTWFGALCYIHRASASLFGVDTMMTVLLLYLMIGPSGAVLSVDRVLARWWARRHGLPEPAVTASVSANLALRLIQVHVCIIYLSAGLAKLQGQTWWTGIAPWGTLANFEYAPMHLPAYVETLRWLAKTRWLYEAAMTAGTLGTLAFEIGYAFLIWRPGTRTLFLWMAVLLHLVIGMFMGLRTFSLMMLAFNMAFLSPATVNWAVSKLTPQRWRSEPPEPPEPVAHEPVLAGPTAIMRQDKPTGKAVTALQAKRKR